MSAERHTGDIPRRDLVVVGASAGGVEALATLAEDLPPDLPAAVLVVLHLPEGATSFLAGILDRAGPLPAVVAADGAAVEPGTIYVAPPDRHLVVEPGRLRLLRRPRINGFRPSIDVLFHSAARAYGSRTIGVILSGALSDGTLGLHAITRRGGVAIVQADAAHEGMPASAIANVDVDATPRLRELAAELTMYLQASEEATAPDDVGIPESELEAGFDIAEAREAPESSPTALRCPECGGAIWALEHDGLESYACHVGHTYSADSLLSEQGDSVERALWTAVRLLEERAELIERLAERMGQRGNDRALVRFERRARAVEQQAQLIRDALLETPEPADEAGEPETAVG